MDRSTARRAFTLIELVLVIAIVGLIGSLLLTGLQMARESARRASCQNNLRQIGLALTNYEAVYGCFPRAVGDKGHGPLVAILPFVEQSQIFNRIDFEIHIAQNSIFGEKIALYRCPSTFNPEIARTDYVFNRGTTLEIYRNSPWFFEEKHYPMLAQFSRGLSHTSLIAEACPNVSGYRPGALIELPKRSILTEQDSRVFIDECDAQSWDSPRRQMENGKHWSGGGVANYYHIFEPNYKSCANGGLWQSSLNTTNSMHPAGVNVLFADAHVELMVNGIDRITWAELGAR